MSIHHMEQGLGLDVKTNTHINQATTVLTLKAIGLVLTPSDQPGYMYSTPINQLASMELTHSDNSA